MIYHKFSHGAAFYTPNGKNVNVMLELVLLINAIVYSSLIVRQTETYYQNCVTCIQYCEQFLNTILLNKIQVLILAYMFI